MLGLVFGFLTPGWHVPETLGAILLVLGVIGMGYFGYDAAGLVLMILGVIFFIAEALTPTFGLFTIAGLVSFILGGLIMFGKGGEVYLVNSETFYLESHHNSNRSPAGTVLPLRDGRCDTGAPQKARNW